MGSIAALRAVLVVVVGSLLIAGCSGEDASAEEAVDGAAAPVRVPEGDPNDLPKVPADEASIRAMLRERFGDAVARTLRFEIEDQGGIRLGVQGEVPSDEVRVAVMNELSARVEGVRYEDFNIQVGGPIPLLWGFDAPVGDETRPAVFSPDLRVMVTKDGHVFEVATGRRINRMAIMELREIESLAFSPDGKLLATGHQDGQIILWDMPLGATHRVLSPPTSELASPWVMAVQFLADGMSLVSINRERGEIHVWDLATGKARLIGAHQTKDAPHGTSSRYIMAASPDGKLIASAGEHDEGLVLWDAAKRSRRGLFGGELFDPDVVAWSSDGRYLAGARFQANSNAGAVLVWDIETMQPRTFASDESVDVEALAFSDDGKTLAVRYDGEQLRLFDFATGQKWLDLPYEKIGSGRGVRFSPGGAVLATEAGSLRPPGVRLWDVSERPGAKGVAAKLPQPLGERVVNRDDLMEQELEFAIRGTFDERNIETLDVEALPDGSVRITGRVSSQPVKDTAGRIAQSKTIRGEMGSIQRRVENELVVTGKYGELKPRRTPGE